MSNVLLAIDGVDRSEYFKPPLRLSPSGDGQIGSTTIHLDQLAGGLDIRPMQDVRVWVPFSTTTNAGIAADGRLFGGRVTKRMTTNVGNTKIWDLPCSDYGVILRKSYRRAATVTAVPLAADTFAQQVIELFSILQGASPTVQLDVVSGVVDLYPTMPAVTYAGGHIWEWYLQQLLMTVHLLDPAIFPSYYMGTQTTFGAIDVFGPPQLNVYDAASPPLSVVSFSDTPTGGEKPVYELFKRDTDASGLAQTQQSWWRGIVVSAQDAASIAAYPNPYDDNGGGWVDGEVKNDTSSNSLDEAQMLVDNIVLAKGAPRDSIKLVTYERVLPGEYVDLEWSLEGIPPGTQYKVVSAAYDWEEPNVIKSTLTLNTRPLGLFEDGSGAYFAPPIEGDDVPPLPAADFTVASNVFNLVTFEADVTLDIDNTGGSPDTAGYMLIGGPTGTEPQELNVGLDISPLLSLPPGQGYTYRVRAYDNAGNMSESFPIPSDPPLTFTTASIFIPPPTAFQIDTSKGEVPNGYDWEDGFYAYPYFKWTAPATLPDFYRVSVWLTANPNGTRRNFDVPAAAVDMRWPFTQRVGLAWTGQIVSMNHGTPSTASTTTFTVPAYVPAPPTSLQLDTAKGDIPNGWVWPNDWTAYPWLKWVAPVPPPTPATPDAYRITVYPTGSPTQAMHRNIDGSLLLYLFTEPLSVGTNYTAEIRAFSNGLPSTAASTTFTVPVWTGGTAPTIGLITQGYTSGQYWCKVTISHSGDHSGDGGFGMASPAGHGGIEIIEMIPPGRTFPYTMRFQGMQPQTYDLTFVVADRFGRLSPPGTGTVTIHSIPIKDTTRKGWDDFSSEYETDERGLEDVGTSGTYLFDDTVLYAGNSTLQLIPNNGNVSVMLPERVALQEDERKAISLAVMGDSPATTGVEAFWVYFDDTDTEISRETIFSILAPAAFSSPPTEYQTLDAPATVKYARIELLAGDVSVNNAWFSRPIVSPVVPSAGIKDGAVTTTQLAAGAVTPAKTFFQASFVAPLPFPDENGDPVVGLWWSGGDETLYFGPLTNPTYGDPGFGYLDGVGAIFRVKNGIMSYSGNTDLVGDLAVGGTTILGTALTDPTTDGYVYIPEIDTAPSGTPTTHSGTAAMCYVPGAQLLYIYDNVNLVWVRVSLA